jgi:hypothetical protein
MSRFDSIDKVIATLYATVSGPAGRAIDWDRERRMYHAAARLMRTGVDDDGRPWIKAMTIDDFIEDTTPFFAENDFYEYEIARHVDRFGNIAQVRSAYEARRDTADPALLKRGVNLIQLYNDGERWWITSVTWDDERHGTRLPGDWLTGRPVATDALD